MTRFRFFLLSCGILILQQEKFLVQGLVVELMRNGNWNFSACFNQSRALDCAPARHDARHDSVPDGGKRRGKAARDVGELMKISLTTVRQR